MRKRSVLVPVTGLPRSQTQSVYVPERHLQDQCPGPGRVSLRHLLSSDKQQTSRVADGAGRPALVGPASGALVALNCQQPGGLSMRPLSIEAVARRLELVHHKERILRRKGDSHIEVRGALEVGRQLHPFELVTVVLLGQRGQL